MITLPLFLRKLFVDFVETGIAAIFALSIVFPTDVASAKQVAFAIGIALLGAAVSAIRRSAPDFLTWLKTKLNTGS